MEGMTTDITAELEWALKSRVDFETFKRTYEYLSPHFEWECTPEAVGYTWHNEVNVKWVVMSKGGPSPTLAFMIAHPLCLIETQLVDQFTAGMESLGFRVLPMTSYDAEEFHLDASIAPLLRTVTDLTDLDEIINLDRFSISDLVYLFS